MSLTEGVFQRRAAICPLDFHLRSFTLPPLMKKKLCGLALVVLTLFFAHPANAVVFGQLDDFQIIDDPDFPTHYWVNGASAVERIASGGPNGSNDAYIQVTSDGSGPGGRLVAQNYFAPPSFPGLWTGNYIATGVTAIEFDLINQSAVSLSIRIAFKTDTFNGSPGYLSAPAILAPGSGWQHFSISILPGSLTAIGGPAAYNTFFQSGFNEMRIINEVGSSNTNGDPVTGQLGIDNIRAVPEPASVTLAAAGFLLLGVRALRAKGRPGRR
jgi:hypothetical protein